MAQIQLRRLSRADYEGLVLAHEKCVTITNLLNHSSWGQAPAVVALLGDVDRFLCELFNKTEAALNRALGVPIAPSPGESSPELPEGSVWDQAVKAAAQDTEIADWLRTQTPETLESGHVPGETEADPRLEGTMTQLILTVGAGWLVLMLLGRQFVWWYLGIGRAIRALESIDASLKCLPAVRVRDERLRRVS